MKNQKTEKVMRMKVTAPWCDDQSIEVGTYQEIIMCCISQLNYLITKGMMGLIDEIHKEEDAKWMALADKYADDAEAEISQKPTIQEEIKKTWDMIEARSMPPEMFDKHEEAMIKELKRRHQEHVETWRCQFCGNQSSVCTCKI